MILAALAQAQLSGARLAEACRVVGISTRTIERWRHQPNNDDRRCGPHRRPSNTLTRAEEAQILSVLTSGRYAGLPPKQLVPRLADEGLYLASESTIYRLQRRHGLSGKKSLSTTHVSRSCTVHRANKPNQVWSWDITWLPTTVRGAYLYLYLIMDVWSRRIVGWRLAARECAELAAELVVQACHDGNVDPRGLVLHSDNGHPMRGSTMISTLQWLGVVPSFSRPHVSDDNAYSEALFRTLKHTPAYPRLPFVDISSAERWVARFVEWYNGEHCHSAIRYVTPNARHFGHESEILARRHQLYQRARNSNPARWSRATRDWSPIAAVTLNPERVPSQTVTNGHARQLP